MKTFLLSLAGAFAALVLFVLVGFVVLGGVIGAATATPPQARDLVLTVDMRDPLADQAPASGLAALSGQPGFTTILTRLKAAETDDTVKGVFIRGSEFGVGSSRAEELRDAILDLQAAGKFVVAHSQGTFGGTGPSALRAISAADEVWLQPGADIFASGVSLETEFLKGLFDKLSISAEIEAFYEYKNAPNSYKEEGYTEPHREALTALAESIWSISLRDIAEDRGLEAAELRALLESGPKSAEEALELNLVDTLGWPEDAQDAATELAEDGNLLDIAAYVPPVVKAGAPMVAIVGGEGPIITGTGDDDLFASTNGFSSDPVAASILEAGRNDKVEAIVFRVDSPGGSPTASDQIWNAIERVQRDGKPVVVSMGSVAASGGYYVSTGADAILASETTITGSIGIFGGKFAVSEGLARIGVNIDDVTVGGPFANAYGPDKFTDDEREVLRAWLKRGYDRFTTLVAEGRDMTVDEVHERARGRVWSGADAIDIGLVDELGGFMDAIDKAKELAEIDAETEVRLIYYPAQKTGLEAIETIFGASAQSAQGLAALGALADDQRVIEVLEELAAVQSGQARATSPRIRER